VKIRAILKLISKRQDEKVTLDTTAARHGLASGSCEHSNQLSAYSMFTESWWMISSHQNFISNAALLTNVEQEDLLVVSTV
jgi:hypothetical protein